MTDHPRLLQTVIDATDVRAAAEFYRQFLGLSYRHLDCTVADLDELQQQRERAEALGASVLVDDTDDAEEPLYVFVDPSGHPFCVFVA
jgi:hypothetical protein